MTDTPDIKMKVRKPSYKKTEAIRLLERLANEEARRRHPDCPFLAPRLYSDKTANHLTRAIIDFLRLTGNQAERISSSGRYLDNSKVITDVLGSKRRVGSGRWIPGSMQKGSADISATINGRSVKIEVKMKDKQSPDQKRYEEQVIRAGGLYWIARSFEEFLTFYNSLRDHYQKQTE
jgi:Holliday junction resolvase